jgi:hypothetical protein
MILGLRAIGLVAVLSIAPGAVDAQAPCLGTAVPRDSLNALADCLVDPNPQVRDGIAFETLSKLLRAGSVDPAAMRVLKDRLLATVSRGGSALQTSFPALTLSEIARTDRIKAWMTDPERDAMVDAAARFLSTTTDYRAFTEKEGYFHSVAHGADFAMQLALNPAITRAQLDRLLAGIATQIAPRDPGVAYWAGEPDRLARSVIFIAQRKLHSDDEWKAWFATVMDPKPLGAWTAAFQSEAGIRKHHNVRLFLLSVFATANTSEDAGIRQLLNPARESLKLVP